MTFEKSFTEYNSVPFRPEVDKLSAEYFYRQGAVDAELGFRELLRRPIVPDAPVCTPDAPCESCRNSDQQEAGHP